MGAKVVAKQQGIALVGIARDPDVDVGAATAGGLVEKELRPQRRVVGLARRHVIVPDGFPALIAGFTQSFSHFRYQRLNRDLDVDHILGAQAGHGRRADMIDPQRERAQDLLERTPDRFKLLGPERVVGVDGNGHGENLAGGTKLIGLTLLALGSLLMAAITGEKRSILLRRSSFDLTTSPHFGIRVINDTVELAEEPTHERLSIFCRAVARRPSLLDSDRAGREIPE